MNTDADLSNCFKPTTNGNYCLNARYAPNISTQLLFCIISEKETHGLSTLFINLVPKDIIFTLFVCRMKLTSSVMTCLSLFSTVLDCIGSAPYIETSPTPLDPPDMAASRNRSSTCWHNKRFMTSKQMRAEILISKLVTNLSRKINDKSNNRFSHISFHFMIDFFVFHYFKKANALSCGHTKRFQNFLQWDTVHYRFIQYALFNRSYKPPAAQSFTIIFLNSCLRGRFKTCASSDVSCLSHLTSSSLLTSLSTQSFSTSFSYSSSIFFSLFLFRPKSFSVHSLSTLKPAFLWRRISALCLPDATRYYHFHCLSFHIFATLRAVLHPILRKSFI